MRQHCDSDTSIEPGSSKRGPGRPPHKHLNNNYTLCSNMMSPRTPPPGGSLCKFAVGQEVLARWNDGLFYLGKIIRVDGKNEKCYIKFEDDSEYWALTKDISKVTPTPQTVAEIICVLCQGEVSEKPNEIVLCDNCGLGYHQRCHNPVISDHVLQLEVQWVCRKCVFATTAKKGGAVKKGPKAQAMQAMKQSLPYELSKLKWDQFHKTNEDQCYCYCGGPGDWYLKMLQCCRCHQWFHEACMQCLQKPLLYGDRFYVFSCAICNKGKEYAKRLQLKWCDIAQLALFSFTMEHNRKYFEFNKDLMPWINDHWDQLLTLEYANSSKLERAQNIQAALEKETGRFQSGKEIKKRHSLWGLRLRLPPPAPSVIYPVEGPINDDTMKAATTDKTIKTKVFTSKDSSCPIPQRYHKRRASNDADELLRKPKKRKVFQSPAAVTTNNEVHKGSQDFQGYSGNPHSYIMNGHTIKRKSQGKPHASANNYERQKLMPNSNASLDSIIPWPTDYEGFNHPFKTVLERNTELAHTKLKERLLNTYTNGALNMDYENDSFMSSFTDSDSQSSAKYEVLVESTNHHRKSRRGRKSKLERALLAAAEAAAIKNAEELEMLRKKPKKVPNHAKNVVDKSMIDGMRHREIPLCQLRTSVQNYFGAADRLASGEGFKVLAKRVSPNSKVQYLVEWEGLVA